MAREFTQMDAVIMFSGVLLAVSLFTLSGDDGLPRVNTGPRRMVGYFFASLGRVFWTVWFLICLTVFAGGLVLKFKYHKEYPWKERESKVRKHFSRLFQTR